MCKCGERIVFVYQFCSFLSCETVGTIMSKQAGVITAVL